MRTVAVARKRRPDLGLLLENLEAPTEGVNVLLDGLRH